MKRTLGLGFAALAAVALFAGLVHVVPHLHRSRGVRHSPSGSPGATPVVLLSSG
jgi:hypothetical protein